MAKAARPIPEGYHTVTPYLAVDSGDEAIRFYKKAFGAEEILRMRGPDGKSVMHAEIRIGDSHVMLAEEFPGVGNRSPKSLGGTSASVHLYVNDVDAAFKRAVEAGAEVVMPVTDMFWGDRFGKVRDPFGQEWSLATAKETLTPEEIAGRAKTFFEEMAKQGGCSE